MPKTSTKKYIYAVGRRRAAVVTVKLFSGKGESQVNNQPVEKYFSSIREDKYRRPFEVTQNESKFYFQSRAAGGGKEGQLEALALALARALQIHDTASNTQPLRQAGLLTVDSRVRQRRMVGTGGKARRKKQSPKR